MAHTKPFFSAKISAQHGTCLNCGSEVTGRYCSACGQELTDRHVRFTALLGEGLSEFFNWDSKLLRSLRPLLFKPGFLTREYVKGRRVRYVAPIRFYLIGSLLFFLIFDPSLSPETLNTASSQEGREALEAETGQAFSGNDSTDGGSVPDSTATDSTPSPVAVPELPFDTTSLPREARAAIRQTDSLQAEAGKGNPRIRNKQTKGEPTFRFYGGDVDTSNFWGRIAYRANKRAEKDNGRGLLSTFLTNIPTTLFFMMPFAALCLWVVHIRHKYDYMEHFVFTLHMHAFIYFYVLLLWGLGSLASYYDIADRYTLVGIGLVVLPVYFYKALRYYYQQSRWKTFAKMVVVFALYNLVNIVVTAIGFLIATYLYIQ